MAYQSSGFSGTLSLAVVTEASVNKVAVSSVRDTRGFQALGVGWTQVPIFVDILCLLGFGQEEEWKAG